MQWLTSPHIHFDRAASAWLILRFVDASATFEFGTELPVDCSVTAFGIPGAAIGPHDQNGSTFSKILERYALRDPTLLRLGQLVDDIVVRALDATVRADHAPLEPLLSIAEGVMLVAPDDSNCLHRSLPIYDALYRGIKARLLLVKARADASVRDCTFDLNAVIKRYRSGTADSAFAELFTDQAGE